MWIIDYFFRSLSNDLYFNLIREDRYMFFIRGLGISLRLTFFAALIGAFLGLFMAFARMTKSKLLRSFATGYIDVIRGTPVVVQLLIIYFAVFGTITHISPIFIASIAFGINSGAYVAELIRAGIQAVDKGQMEAARSVGLSYPQAMTYVVIPQAIKNILPAMVNEVIVLWKETAIAGLIGLDDLTRAAQIVRGRTFSPYTPFLIIALIYLYITTIMTAFLGRIERGMRRSD